MAVLKNTVFIVDLVDSSFFYPVESMELDELVEKKVWLALQSALLDADKDKDPLFLKANVNIDASTIANIFCIKKILKCQDCSDERKRTVGSDYILAFMTILEYTNEDKIYQALNIQVSTIEEAKKKLNDVVEAIHGLKQFIASDDLKSTMLKFILGKGD